MLQRKWAASLRGAVGLLVLLAQGCAFDSTYEFHWNVSLDAPARDVTIAVGTPLYVRAHSDIDDQPQSMAIMVNDVAIVNLTLSSQEGNPPLWVGDGAWTPVAMGTYNLFVRLTSQEGVFDSNGVRVSVLSAPPAVTGTAAAFPTVAPLQTPLLELSADNASLNAGECTFLRWRVSISPTQSIDLNGQQVPPQGEMQVCPCFTTHYDLIVLAGDKYAQSVTIQVNGICALATTPAPPANNALNFCVDSANLQAGNCTILHWDSVNALKVYLDGQEVPAIGQKRVCPCSMKTYSLEAGFTDGSKQERSLTINVTGSCQAPLITVSPSPQDTTPPPVPAPLSPGSGSESNPSTQYCPVTLRWYAVSDPSGVSYQIRLDKRIAARSWSTIGTWDTSVTEHTVPNNSLFCDYTDYRWRVRAVDGAGNNSNWSVWFYFTMPVP